MGVKSVEKLEQMPRTQEYKLKGVNNKDTRISGFNKRQRFSYY